MIKKTKTISVLLSLCLIVSMLTSMLHVSAVSNSDHVATNNADYSEDYVAPDIIDKDELETTDYVGRVLENEKDLYTFIFKNGDGSNTMRVFSHPVKYIDDEGATRDISLEISKSKDGTFVAADHMVKADFGTSIADGIGLEYNDIKVSMKAFDANANVNAVLSADGKKLTYAVDNKTSYVYSLTYLGVKEDIVVSEYTGQTEYKFSLFTNGLHPVKIDNSVFLSDGNGDIKASIGDIIIFTADERNNTFGDLLFETIVENEEYAFTIILDEDYLKNEKTAYPITIDPTIEVNFDNNGAGAIEDVTINENVTFSGTLWSLYVGRHPAGSLSRTLMRFPNLSLSGISANQITSASVEIRDLMCQGDEDITIDCCIYNNSSPAWTESGTTTWSSVGTSYVGTVLDSLLVSYGHGNVSAHRYGFNILNLAKAWANGTQSPSKGIVFKANNTFENQTGTNIKTWYKTFSSYNRDCYQPSLTINYNESGFDNATSLSLGTYYSVSIVNSGGKQFYKYTPSTTGFYTFESSSIVSGDPYGRLYNNNQDILANNNDSGSGTNFRITYHLMSSYTYYFSAGCYGTGTGNYSVRLYKTSSASYIESPTVIAWGNTKSISTSYSQASKYYKFTPSVSGEYLFYSSDNTGDPRVWIYNSSLTLVGNNDDNAGNKNFRLVVSLTSGNTYYIAAGHFSTYIGNYKMSSMMAGNITTGVNHIRNIGSQMYIDIQGPSAQEYVEQWSIYTAESEKWTIKKQSDGYYTLQSEYGSKKFMGVENSNIGEDNVKLYSSIGDNTKWKIFVHPDGDLIIEPKNYNGKVLYVPSNSISANLQLEWMSAVVSSRNKWKIEYSSTTPLEGQRWTNWCWATSARMLVKHYYSSMPNTRDQPNAVREVHGSIIDRGGNHVNAISAAGYYRSADISINVLNLTGAFGSRFSESTLRQFLDDNHVVYIARGHYSLSNVRNGGHATLIVGYTTVFVNGSMQYRFKINDPWPLSEPTEWPDNYVDSTTGQVLIRSYQWICNGRTGTASTDIIDDGIWDRYVVVTTSYSSSVLTPVWN